MKLKLFLALLFATTSQATIFNSVTVESDLILSGQTATTVPYLDALNKVVSSTVTPTQLEYINSLSSNAQTQLNSKQAALGYTPEDVANKATDLTSPDNTKYPSTLAVSNAISAIPSASPQIYSTKVLYVDPVNGSNASVTGRGSVELPYLTIQAAFNSVSAATSLNQWANERLVINLLGGEYTEAAPVVYYKRRSINFIGNGAKIVNDFTLNYDPTAQYTGFTYTQAGLPAPWTSGFASPTLSLACAENANGMESGFTTGCLLFLGRVVFVTPNYTTQTSPNYGSSYVTMNGVEARAGFQMNELGASSNASMVLEMMTSVINGNNLGLTRNGGVASSFTLKASNSRPTSVIGPRAIIAKLDSCRVGKLDRTTDTNGTTGIYLTDGGIQFTNTTSTSGITNSTFTGSGTQLIGNQTGTTNSTIKIDQGSWYQLRALTLDIGGGITYNIMDAPKVTRVVAANAGSTTITATTDHLLLDPAALIAGYTVTMKAAPVDGDELKISGGAFGITALTLNANTGQTFATGASVSTLPASSYVSYRWNAATAKWFQIGSSNITSSSGITSLNSLTASTQTFATGTTGTDFGISSATSTHTFNLPTASATNRGALSSADWSTFNSKGSGTVTNASVISANGFAGSVATSTTTPAITLTTTITGMLKGAANALVAAVSGTDYSAGTSGNTTGIVKSTTGTGALTTAIAADFPTLNQSTTGSAASFTGSLVGDVTGTQGATVLANTAVTPGAYTNANITVDSKGRITLAANGSGGSAAWGSITGTLSSQTDLQSALNAKLDSSSFTDAAVTSKLITGYVSGAGVVAATDTILQSINKLNGNTADKVAKAGDTMTGNLINDQGNGNTATMTDNSFQTTETSIGSVAYIAANGAGTLLVTDSTAGPRISGGGGQLSLLSDNILTPSVPTANYHATNKKYVDDGLALKLGISAFTDASVTSKLITGFSSGAGAVTATDSILQAINKLDGNVSGKQASGSYITSLTSDVTASGPGAAAATIAANAVTNAKAAQMATQTIKGRTTAGTGSPEDLTKAQVKTMLGIDGVTTTTCTTSLALDFTGVAEYDITLTNASTCVLTITGMTAGSAVAIRIIQSAGGTGLVTWPAGFKWPGGTAPTLTATASSLDAVSVSYNGTNYIASAGLNFQ